MKTALILVLLACLTGCALTPEQKKWTGFVAGVLVVGALAAHNQDNGSPSPIVGSVTEPGKPCTPQPDGSCR